MEEGKSVPVYVESATQGEGAVVLRGFASSPAKAGHARQVSAGNANSYLILEPSSTQPTTSPGLPISPAMATYQVCKYPGNGNIPVLCNGNISGMMTGAAMAIIVDTATATIYLLEYKLYLLECKIYLLEYQIYLLEYQIYLLEY